MARTTPDLRLELSRLSPELQQSLCKAVRLHPRRVPVPQKANVSKVGGQFLWPAKTPWPICHKGGHNEPFVPLVQLLKSDFPQLPFPARGDVFQLLWCPWGHEGDGEPSGGKVFWRESQECVPVAEESTRTSFNSVTECSLMPEVIDDMACWLELAADDESEHDCARRLLGDDALEQYTSLSGGAAPGLKLFGRPLWIQYPEVPSCGCGRGMDLLLSVTNREFDDPAADFWCPQEDQAEHKRLMAEYWRLKDPSRYEEFASHSYPLGFDIGDSGTIYLFYCAHCPGPRTEALIQYS